MQSVLMTCLLTEHQIGSIESHSYNGLQEMNFQTVTSYSKSAHRIIQSTKISYRMQFTIAQDLEKMKYKRITFLKIMLTTDR